MKEEFYDYLVAQGLKECTPSGRKSTVYSYCNRIEKICEKEGLTWQELAENIANILPKYDICGKEEAYGLSSAKTPINALRAFAGFVEHNNQKTE